MVLKPRGIKAHLGRLIGWNFVALHLPASASQDVSIYLRTDWLHSPQKHNSDPEPEVDKKGKQMNYSSFAFCLQYIWNNFQLLYILS